MSWDFVSRLFWLPLQIMQTITRNVLHFGRIIFGKPKPALKPPPSPPPPSKPSSLSLSSKMNNASRNNSASPPPPIFSNIPSPGKICVVDIPEMEVVEVQSAEEDNEMLMMSRATTLTIVNENEDNEEQSGAGAARAEVEEEEQQTSHSQRSSTSTTTQKRLKSDSKRMSQDDDNNVVGLGLDEASIAKKARMSIAKDDTSTSSATVTTTTTATSSKSSGNNNSSSRPKKTKPRSESQSQSESGSISAAAEKKKKKRSKSKKDKKNETESSQSDSMMGRMPPPNFFLAVQVSDKKIIDQVRQLQDHLSTKPLDPPWHDLKSTNIFRDAMVPLTKLHFTLYVMNLRNDDEINRARLAVTECCSAIVEEFQRNPLDLTIEGLGHFKSSVIFAQIKGDEHIARLTRLSELLRGKLDEQNIKGDSRPFKPHMTIAKISRSNKLHKKKIRAFPQDIWTGCEDTQFGVQRVNGVQLLSMQGEDKVTGYYRSFGQFDFFHEKPELKNPNPAVVTPEDTATSSTQRQSESDDKN